MSPGRSSEAILAVPEGIDSSQYRRCLFGPIAFGLSLGMQIMMTAFLRLGPSSNKSILDQLSEPGRKITRPEHDLIVYVAGILFTLILMTLILGWWRSRLARVPAANAARFMTSSSLLHAILAAASMIAFLLLLCSDWFSQDIQFSNSGTRQPTGFSEINLLLPAAMALVCAAIDARAGFLDWSALPPRFASWRQLISRTVRYGTPILVVLIIGVPPRQWAVLAGQFFLTDGCHHLNFFMMGPALAFTHGDSFGTAIFSQYGIGWPFLLSILSRFSGMTYSNILGLGIVYGCVYYLALFFVLRTCFKEEIWAAIGVVLAIYWQLFSGMSEGVVIWLMPSSTMMRHPMDVWFFLTLLGYQRARKMIWLVLAGGVTGLGIFFETETGAYLLVTFLFFWILQAGLAPAEGRPAGKRESFGPPFVFYITVAATLLPLLFYASRGTFFRAAFWHGWVEGLVMYASLGVGALPIAELPDTPLILFQLMVTIYLAIIACAAANGLHGAARKNQILLATVATYGLALLLVFVNRSHPYNLCHVGTGFAVVVTALLFWGRKMLAGALPHSSFCYVFAAGLVLLLLTKTEFMRYPSCLRSLFATDRPIEAAAKLATANPAVLPPHAEDFVQRFAGISAAIRTVAPDGQNIAILDSNDTVLYYAAGAKPWSRYASLFNMILTKRSLEELRQKLIEKPPRWVVIRGQNSLRPAKWEFVWRPLYQVVTNRYDLWGTASSYEIWRLSKPIEGRGDRVPAQTPSTRQTKE